MNDSAPVLPPRILHPLLDLPGIQHGFFTRLGGVSAGLYDSLNVGQGSRDDEEAVHENRRRVAASFARNPEHLLSLYQTHSTDSFIVEEPWPNSNARPEGDGLVTTTPGVIVSALSADCAPLLFADPENGVVAACHAGWKGALKGIVESTLASMQTCGAELSSIRCVIGPCIAQSSYEVGADYAETFAASDPDSPPFFAPAISPEKRMFDLAGYCLMRVRRAGISQAATTGHDTCAQSELFFSNRRAFRAGQPDYGRLISAIMIRV